MVAYLFDRVKRLLTWLQDTDEDTVKGLERKSLRVTRFFQLLGNLFVEDRVGARASALTYTTLLSIFPMVILITALASAFSGGARDLEGNITKYIEERIMPSSEGGMGEYLSPQKAENEDKRRKALGEITASIQNMFKTFRENAAGIGFAGFLGVLIAAGLLYWNIESAFNEIWRVPKGLQLLRTFVTFTTLMVATPILIGASVTASITIVKFFKSVEGTAERFVDGQGMQSFRVEEDPLLAAPADSGDSPSTATLALAQQQTPAAGKMQPTYRLSKFVASLVPTLINSIMLCLAYMIVPRAKVRFGPAIIGGLVAGFLWEAAKIGFGYYIFSSSLRNALYRSLGAVPILLIWIYFSWIIFLIGNEVCYIVQNWQALVRERYCRKAYTVLDSKLLYAMALLIAEAFDNDKGGLTYAQLKEAFGLRDVELQEAIARLEKLGFIVRTEKQKLYTVTRPASHMKIHDLLAAGCDVPILLKSPRFRSPRVTQSLAELQASALRWREGQSLQNVLAEAPAPSPGGGDPLSASGAKA